MLSLSHSSCLAIIKILLWINRESSEIFNFGGREREREGDIGTEMCLCYKRDRELGEG